MTLAGVLALITGVLQFPSQVLALVNALKSTPEENRQAIMDAVTSEASKYQSGGRPTWN